MAKFKEGQVVYAIKGGKAKYRSYRKNTKFRITGVFSDGTSRCISVTGILFTIKNSNLTKVAPVKVVKPKFVAPVLYGSEDLPALKSFAGWTIKRRKDRIIFGCGSVSMSNSDILRLADIVENKEFVKIRAAIKAVIKSDYLNLYQIIDAFKLLKNFKDSDLQEFADFERITNIFISRYSKEATLTLDPMIIRRIVGPIIKRK